jgi:hypothetical protein
MNRVFRNAAGTRVGNAVAKSTEFERPFTQMP